MEFPTYSITVENTASLQGQALPSTEANKYLKRNVDNAAWEYGSPGGGGALIGQVGAQVWRSVTMTNIGTAYKTIYDSTAFDEEHLSGIDFANVTDIRIIAIWGYIGGGTQQLRWVDQASDANVLWESGTFTADQDPLDSGWVTKPAWATGFFRIKWQGKSTIAANDPVAKGYKILLR